MILQDMLASTAHGQGPDRGPFPGLFRAMTLFEALLSRCSWQQLLLVNCGGGDHHAKSRALSRTSSYCSMGCPPDHGTIDRAAAQPDRAAG